MLEDPLVTVYIPTFNRQSLLERAVNSVLSQTYHNIELIIVDDCSNDGTHKYLEALAHENGQVKYIINSENSGACTSRNNAIIEANGHYVTGLDDDDYFLENRILNFVEFVQATNVSVAYSNYLLRSSSASLQKKLKPKSVNQKNLLLSNYIGNQVFCEAGLLKETLFDASLKKFQDLDCWYRLTAKTEAYNTSHFDYVVDHSHAHERISDSRNTSSMISYLNAKYEDNFDAHILNYKHVTPGLVQKLNIFNAPNLKYACIIMLKLVYFLVSSQRQR